MARFDTILWDVDGTLLDFAAAEEAAIRSLFADFGLGVCTDAMLARYSEINRNYWRALERGEMTKPEILTRRFEDFFAAEGLSGPSPAEFNAAYQTRLGDTIVYCDGSDKLVASLRGKVRQYAVSNGTVAAQTRKLARSGFDRLMDGIFLSERIGWEKPAKEFFDAVFREIGEERRAGSIIVGDSLTSDIAGANRAGIKSCWYNPRGAENGTNAKPDFEIKDLREILEIL
ncbi:MAG TPA: noncanonical pyrimidine nucleotidase, YjjG family [Candidatus Caccocola faecipullorum]|nr:noncanonical pyrimidine nucleotidase, YjjG family [Candidatus Caccocola faecipullorum]